MSEKEFYEIVKFIRNIMKRNDCHDILIKRSGDLVGRLLFNKTKSPHGAKGMFLLVPIRMLKGSKEGFSGLDRLLWSELEIEGGDLASIYQIKKGNDPDALQLAFEEYTKNILEKAGFVVERVSEEEMNLYDLSVSSKKNASWFKLIEVKSDRYRYTGNVSLELMRNWDKSHPENRGSIIKTAADWWQVYFYDKEKGEFDSKVFVVKELKSVVETIIVQLASVLREKGVSCRGGVLELP